MKKLSLTSSLNDYSSSTNNEPELEYSNGHKYEIPENFSILKIDLRRLCKQHFYANRIWVEFDFLFGVWSEKPKLFPLNRRLIDFHFRSLGTPSSETSSVTSHDMFSMSSYANSSAIDSSNYQKGGREGGRAKWGSYLFDSFSKDNGRSSRNTNGPVWLEKSLSEARDSEEETMSISVQSVSSFLRGQNVPVDPIVLAERESKRRKAMELQQAIKEQLQERENLKRMEKEKQYQIEKFEEERMAKQVEMERKRLEKEQNLQYEKLEAERKREEAMRRALEKAAQEAQMERDRKRREKVVMQNTIDETISIQKIGEKTEIFIDQQPQSGRDTPKVDNLPQMSAPESNIENDEEEDDGETVLIGTPIKLKKKNLETFRRKFHKRQQNVDESKSTSDEEVSTPKTAKSVQSNNEKNQMKQQTKMLSELDGIALVLQSMPLMPFVPLSNDVFGLNQLNNLAILMAAQNRLNTPNVMLPIIPRDTNATTPSTDRLDLSQFIIPPNSQQQTITLQIQQVEPKSAVSEIQARFQSVPPTPDLAIRTDEVKGFKSSETFDKTEDSLASQAQSEALAKTVPLSTTPLPLPHDGTFTKEECHTHDAFTSTTAENRFVDEEREVKILTPQKYRNEMRLMGNAKTIGTQTESFLFCEYCSFQHQHHHQHHCAEQENAEETDATAGNIQIDGTKLKDRKSENRPQWGVRNPPVKYLKASERDPFYGKNRKKRYLKKAVSESEKTDDTCAHRDCPLVKNPTPLLPKRLEKFNRDNLCKNMLPIRYDRFGRICLDEQNFIANEAFRRVQKSDVYTSDAESIVDIRHKSFFLPKTSDFQDIFGD